MSASDSQGTVRMSARVVEDFRGRWLPAHEEVHDPGVALDTASSMEAVCGPTVLRVEPAAPRAATRGRVPPERPPHLGDWLCDPERPGANHRLPTPRWDFDGASGAARLWSERRELSDAWEACDDPRWLLRTAGLNGVGVRQLTLAAAACARLVLPAAIGPSRALAERAVAAAEEFGRTGRSGGEVQAAFLAASDDFCADGDPPARRASCAVSQAAGVAGRIQFFSAMLADPFDGAGSIAAHAADYARDAALGSGVVGVADLADAVRGAVRTIDYLRAVRDNARRKQFKRDFSDRDVVRRPAPRRR